MKARFGIHKLAEVPRAGVAFLVGLALALFTARARAHVVGLSGGEYSVEQGALRAKLTFARSEVARLLPTLDADHDSHVSALEVHAAEPGLREKILGRIRVRTGDATCTAALQTASLTEQDGLTIDARFVCPRTNEAFDVDFSLLQDLAPGHRHIARVLGDGIHDEVLYEDHSALSISATPPTSQASEGIPSTPPVPAVSTHSAWEFFKLGIMHILKGYDHLLFLFGLVLVRARGKDILAVVTAFTIAHSITLGLAASGVFMPSERIVEPAIALSIVYVGIENFFLQNARRRWRITFPFGLIHGFGFAGALQQIHLSKAAIPSAVLSFNAGIELGQILAISLMLPGLILLWRMSWYRRYGLRAISAAVALVGCAWFAARIAT